MILTVRDEISDKMISFHIFTYTSLASGTLILDVGFVALRPKSTAMVIAGRSVHLATLFPGQA